MSTKVAAKGQVTLPKVLHEAAGIRPGDRVSVRAASSAAMSGCADALGVERAAMSDEALWRAGMAFRDYRRRGGAKTSVHADFFIGAQANAMGVPILTRDAARYRAYFPEVEVIGPG